MASGKKKIFLNKIIYIYIVTELQPFQPRHLVILFQYFLNTWFNQFDTLLTSTCLGDSDYHSNWGRLLAECVKEIYICLKLSLCKNINTYLKHNDITAAGVSDGAVSDFHRHPGKTGVCVWFKGISVELMKTISAWVNVKQFSDSLSLIIQTEAAIK